MVLVVKFMFDYSFCIWCYQILVILTIYSSLYSKSSKITDEIIPNLISLHFLFQFNSIYLFYDGCDMRQFTMYYVNYLVYILFYDGCDMGQFTIYYVDNLVYIFEVSCIFLK